MKLPCHVWIGILLLSLATGLGRADGSGVAGQNLEPTRVVIRATGDIMVHSTQLMIAHNSRTDAYDFRPSFAPIRDTLTSADVTFANLETVLAGKEARYTGYPQFNSPTELADAVRWAGFQVVTTANNHAMDRGKAGVLKTLQALDAVGLRHTGTFASQASRDTPLILNVKGIHIGVIAYTFGTNGLPVPDSYLVNRIDTKRIARDAAAARAAGADIVVAAIHWGQEYQRQPNATQRTLARQIIAGGVDILLGSHPHVLEPYEQIQVGSGPSARTGLVFYSLGNFLSSQRGDHKDEGMIAQIELVRSGSGAITLDRVSYIPTYVDYSRKSGFRVLAIDQALKTEADPSLAAKLKAARANTMALLGPYQ